MSDVLQEGGGPTLHRGLISVTPICLHGLLLVCTCRADWNILYCGGDTYLYSGKQINKIQPLFVSIFGVTQKNNFKLSGLSYTWI